MSVIFDLCLLLPLWFVFAAAVSLLKFECSLGYCYCVSCQPDCFSSFYPHVAAAENIKPITSRSPENFPVKELLVLRPAGFHEMGGFFF